MKNIVFINKNSDGFEKANASDIMTFIEDLTTKFFIENKAYTTYVVKYQMEKDRNNKHMETVIISFHLRDEGNDSYTTMYWINYRSMATTCSNRVFQTMRPILFDVPV